MILHSGDIEHQGFENFRVFFPRSDAPGNARGRGNHRSSANRFVQELSDSTAAYDVQLELARQLAHRFFIGFDGFIAPEGIRGENEPYAALLNRSQKLCVKQVFAGQRCKALTSQNKDPRFGRFACKLCLKGCKRALAAVIDNRAFRNDGDRDVSLPPILRERRYPL